MLIKVGLFTANGAVLPIIKNVGKDLGVVGFADICRIVEIITTSITLGITILEIGDQITDQKIIIRI
jgi:hypothetical protein